MWNLVRSAFVFGMDLAQSFIRMYKRTAPIKFRYFFLLLVLLLTTESAFSQTPVTLPTPSGFVNDFAGVMDSGTKQQLEARLTQFKQRTNPSVEIAVAIVDTTGDRPIFDYSLQMAREWKIGSKEGDNPGALLMVAISDRKYFTQVSRDLEDELPDGVAGQIQRQYLVPEFKQGNYSKGIADTIDAYIRTIEAKQSGIALPTVTPTPGKPVRVQNPPGGAMIGCCLIIGIVIIIIIVSSRRGKSGKDDDRWGGGGFGSGGGGSDIATNVLAGVAGAIIGNMLGGGRSSGGSSSSWGGSSGGGGGGWGGFGGGGDFGGGGAGGDW